MGKLEKKIKALDDALSELGDGQELKELLRIIQKPGWTTPAELFLTFTILEAMSAQVQALGNLKAALLKGSNQVGA